VEREETRQTAFHFRSQWQAGPPGILGSVELVNPVALAPNTLKLMATRLYFIVARKTPVAVVFRRGPSRQVELLRWNLVTDEVQPGQWLKGRIYERRCDLAPSGDLLLYFAAKYETTLRTWTAISRVPFLTALALWPKGDAWGGGGLFSSERAIELNHRPEEMALAKGFRLAKRMRVGPFGDRSGFGEDEPIHHERLVREGWTLLERDSQVRERATTDRWLTFDPPIVYRREIGVGRATATLELSIDGLMEQDGPWYLLSYRLLRDDAVIRDLGKADWADRSPNGDLLLAQDGRLLRLASPMSSDGWATTNPVLVTDLAPHRFESRIAPPSATQW
jgi:hypothetical protein